MSGPENRTNWLLFFAVFLLCLVCPVLFTQTQSTESPLKDASPAMFAAADSNELTSSEATAETDAPADKTSAASPESLTSDAAGASNEADTSNTSAASGQADISDESDAAKDGSSSQESPTPAPSQTPIPEQSAAAGGDSQFEVSPEAENGVWKNEGSSWKFMVNDTPYTGWLTDTDGHRYYFDSDGIMQTGLIETDGNQYYLDSDGILITSDIEADGVKYIIGSDGVITKTQSKTGDAKAATGSAITKKEPTKSVALTFDDGPSDFTDRLLDCLAANNSQATFFMVGYEIELYPDTVQHMIDVGCELGNHSYNHADLTQVDPDIAYNEFAGVDNLLQSLVNTTSTLYRPPFGDVDTALISVADKPMILWNVDTEDWDTRSAEATVESVLNNVSDGSIILMHDLYGTTVDAVEIFLPQLIEMGYQVVTVSELARLHGVTLQPGETYSNF